MTMLTCPDCGRSIPAAAPACSHCGRPTGGRVTTATAPKTQSYSAPAAAYAGPVGASLPYFEVALAKFVVMSIVTFGLYDLYWMYQQWKRLKIRTMDDLSPFWRTFFAPLWGFLLFWNIRGDAIKQGVSINWGSGSLGLAYLVLNVLWRLPDPWWLISLLSFVPIIPPVRAITAMHDRLAEDRDRNARLSAANIAGAVFGGILLFLAVIGTFMS